MADRKKFTTEELTPGEFFDRFTIIIRKALYDPKNYKPRVEKYVKLLSQNGYDGQLIKAICELQMANTDVWNLESEVRRGQESELGFAEVGKRALAIREKNKERIEQVNRINQLFGEKRKESKFDHASEKI